MPFSQKCRTLVATFRSAIDPHLHVADLDGLAALDGQDARHWGERTLGPDAYVFFVRLAFEPFFFYDASEVSAAYIRALLGHSVHWRLFAPRGGMGTLCQTLASRLPVECNVRVFAVERKTWGFLVEHSTGAERARSLIVAIPPPAMKRVEIPLDDQDHAALVGVRLVPSLRLNLGYERANVLDPPAITPAGPGRRAIVGISAVTGWMRASAPKNREIIRVSASAWRSEELLGQPPAHAIRELLSDCRALGLELPPPDWADVLEESCAIVHTPPGHFRLARDFVMRARNGLYFAGDWLTGSTVEGAVRSGEAAAARVTSEFRK